MLCADCRATDRAAREYLMAVREFPLETRRQRVDAEAERLAGLGASYVLVLSAEGSTTTESPCKIPRATSST